MADDEFESFYQEVENIRSVINAVEHSIRILDENMAAFEAFEKLTYAPVQHQSMVVLDLKTRRANLSSTHSTLSRRLESMERELSVQ